MEFLVGSPTTVGSSTEALSLSTMLSVSEMDREGQYIFSCSKKYDRNEEIFRVICVNPNHMV
jgi:hypothetical protein